MASPSDPRRLKLERLQEQHCDVKAAYDRERSQLKGQVGAAETQIEQKLEPLVERLTELAQQISDVEKSLEDCRLSDLADCLETAFENDPETIKQIFRQALPQGALWCKNQNPASAKELVTILSKITLVEQPPYPPLLVFAGYLLLAQALSIPGLQDWLQESVEPIQGGRVDDLLNTLSTQQQTQQPSSCLLVRVRPVAQSDSPSYRLTGLYIEDVEAYQDSHATGSPYSLPNDTEEKPVTFTKAQFDTKLRALIEIVLDDDRDLPDALHLFLPPELMHQPIDQWISAPDIDAERTFALEHEGQIYLRCEGRLGNRRVQKKWKDRWGLHNQGQVNPTRAFLPADEQNLTAAEAQFKRSRETFGLKLTCPPKRLEGAITGKSIFKWLANVPIPAVLWLRQPHPTASCEDCLNEVLNCEQLEDIPGKVADRRLLVEPDHLGQHVSILWDNPYLTPP
ncbi:MAG: hypothetical protein AAFU71_13035 [Cyanobacteria bacterium J06632_22]